MSTVNMISKDRPYRTRSGCEVVLYTTDAGGTFPVHGAYMTTTGGGWHVAAWGPYGEHFRGTARGPHPTDLVEVYPLEKQEAAIPWGVLDSGIHAVTYCVRNGWVAWHRSIVRRGLHWNEDMRRWARADNDTLMGSCELTALRLPVVHFEYEHLAIFYRPEGA